MSDATIFVVVMLGLFVLRAIAATVVFCWILPEGDRCPNCDSVTLRMQNRWMERLLPCFRSSWCYRCGWEGVLRKGEATPDPVEGRRVPTDARKRKMPNETSDA